MINDLARVADTIGFEILGDTNPLSGGIDFRTFTTFQGNTLDFGPFDLTLQGPLSVQFSTGGRGIRGYDVAFSTATSSASAPSPLNYVFNVDSGNQQATISGSLLLDGALSINELGFYDLRLNVSSRQTTDSTGLFADGTRQDDFDIGPIDVSGNIYADILAAVFDPIFDQAGVPNLFSDFSGREKLQDAILAQTQVVAADLQPTSPLRVAEVGSRLFSDAAAGAVRSNASRVATAGGQPRVVIPAPPTLALLLVSVPLILSRRAWRRRHGWA
ncbi:MAG: hypothetical protein C4547_13055 [Phycisphaerales bacterium]|nr:MAG: hypothetical protein C4547_13055 [Phycisphaerales bacterium]